MHTRCPTCQEVFELEARHLSQAGGVVRCGGCQETFNALAGLFDDWPDGEQAPTGGMPPELPAPDQGNLCLPEEGEDETNHDHETPTAPPPRPGRRRNNLWPALALGLASIAAIQWVTMDKAQREAILNMTGGLNVVDSAEAMAVTSRDLHPHPSLDEAVILSATVTNRAPRAIPLPTLEVRLLEESGRIIGTRRFSPEQYRPTPASSGDAPGKLLHPDVNLTVVLELVPAGGQPHDFEIRFL